MTTPRTVSIVICTHGARRESLARLVAALDWQTMPFELVIVLGPASPETRTFVERLPADVQRVECDALNISRARNAGITAATGDIIVFIDDDARPATFDWLEALIAPLRDSGIGASGGPVYSGETDSLEYAGGATSACGFQRFTAEDATDGPPDDTRWMPRVPGGNCAFSWSALAHVGGFDEQFAYYLDETDLSVRLIDAGYRVEYAAAASIRHFAAPSAHGQAGLRHRYPIARSDAYFVLRHAPGSWRRRVAWAIRAHRSKHFVLEGRAMYERGEITRAALVRFRLNCWRGLAGGIWAGLVQGPAFLARADRPSPRPPRARPVRVIVLDPVPRAQMGDLVPPRELASWAATLQRSPLAPAVMIVSDRLSGADAMGVACLAPPPDDDAPCPPQLPIPQVARDAMRWIRAVHGLGLTPSLDLLIWPGSADTGALIAESLGRPFALVLIPDASAAADDLATLGLVRCSDALVGPRDARLTSVDDVIRLGLVPDARREAGTTRSVSTVARSPWDAVVGLLVRGLARETQAGNGGLVIWHEDMRGLALTTVRHCLLDGDHEMALTLGTAMRARLPHTDAQAMQLDYFVAHALRALGRADDARDVYEQIRQRGPCGHETATLVAGACFHLAVDACARAQEEQAARLLAECLAYLPAHAAARRLLEDLRRRAARGLASEPAH